MGTKIPALGQKMSLLLVFYIRETMILEHNGRSKKLATSLKYCLRMYLLSSTYS
jgi:hypothetical protein